MNAMDADVTPELIEEIDFSEKFRGYDPDQVDRFLERVGATLVVLQGRIEELSLRAQRAESEVVELRERPMSLSGLSDDEDIEVASRTLLLAKRTAEAAIAEARQEAAALLGEARARAEAETTDATVEADRLVSEAQSQRDELLGAAREEVERETVVIREQLRSEIAELEARKSHLATDLAAMEAHVEHYRGRLEGVSEAIRTVLDDPEALKVKPLAVDTSPPGSAFYYTGSNPVVTAATTSPLSSPAAEAAREEIPPPEFVVPDAVSPAGASVDADVEPGAAAEGEPAGAADPWAPGSWSEVSAVLDEREASGRLFVDDGSDRSGRSFEEVFEPAEQAGEGIVTQPVDQPTEAYDAIDDRYLRDLDQAVNAIDSDDDAMSAFFDGGEDGGRRFGRRR